MTSIRKKTAKKTAAKQTAAKKTATQATAKKTAANKSVPKKTANKATANKATAKKTTIAKKTAAKKTAANQTATAATAPKPRKPPPPGAWQVRPFVECFAFLPGRRMLTGHALTNEILEWDLDSGQVVKVRRKGRKSGDGTNSLAVSPDGLHFLSEGQDHVLRVWAIDQDGPIRELTGHRNPLNVLAYLDDHRAISGGNDGMLRIWDLEAGTCVRAMNHRDHVVGIAVTPDRRTAWTGGWDGVNVVRRWDLTTGAHIDDVATFREPCSGMALSPDGTAVACVTYGGALHVLDAATGAPRVTHEQAHDDRIDAVSWSGDGAYIATISEFDQTIRLFRRDGAACSVIRDMPRPARGVFGPDGLLYVAIAYQGIARYRISADHTLVQQLE